MKSEVSQSEVDSFKSSFVPWGHLDVVAAIGEYKDAGKDADDLVEAIEQFSEDCDVPLDKIDPVYTAWDTLYQEARTDIENATGKDICNDEPYSRINIFSNYIDTQLDAKEDDLSALRSLIEQMEEKTPVVEWLLSKI